jgi:serine/threonine-protein kinase RsbW
MAGAETLKFAVNGGVDAAADARLAATELLGAETDPRTIEDILLVISELVTNAVRHAGAGRGETIEVCVTDQGETILIEVMDGAPGSEPKVRSDDGPGGMGLMVVSGLCADWGTRQSEGRKTVWAEYSPGAAEERVF